MEGKMEFKKVKLEKKVGLKALSLPSFTFNLREQEKYLTI